MFALIDYRPADATVEVIIASASSPHRLYHVDRRLDDFNLLLTVAYGKVKDLFKYARNLKNTNN